MRSVRVNCTHIFVYLLVFEGIFLYLERFFFMKKKEIVDDVTMKRAITRITYEIIERNKNLTRLSWLVLRHVVFILLSVFKSA